jgi:hypothetical protein
MSLYIPMAYGMRKGQKRKSTRLLRLLDNTTALRDFRQIGELTMDRIIRVKHPTLAIYGELSPFLPTCNFLTENMPNCQSVIVSTGHFHPALEPEVFVRNVIAFLQAPETFAAVRLESDAGNIIEKRNVLDNLEPGKDTARQYETETDNKSGETGREG